MRLFKWAFRLSPLRVLAGGIAVAGLTIGIVGFIVLNAVGVGRDALDARDATARAATARITQLQGRITDLQGQAERNSARIGQLETGFGVVSAQVERMGGTPLATIPPPVTTTTSTTTRPPSSTTSTSRATTTTTQPRAATTTSTTAPQPPPTTTTTAPPRCVVLNLPPGCKP